MRKILTPKKSQWEFFLSWNWHKFAITCRFYVLLILPYVENIFLSFLPLVLFLYHVYFHSNSIMLYSIVIFNCFLYFMVRSYYHVMASPHLAPFCWFLQDLILHQDPRCLRLHPLAFLPYLSSWEGPMGSSSGNWSGRGERKAGILLQLLAMASLMAPKKPFFISVCHILALWNLMWH